MARRRIICTAALVLLALAVVSFIGRRPAQAFGGEPAAHALSAPDLFYAFSDAYVTETYPDGNYGSGSLLVVALLKGPARAESLLRFDFYGIPPGAVISDATLYVYHQEGSGPNPTIEVHRLTSNWTETGVTWNNRPGHSPAIYDAVAVGTVAGWISWDVTGLVQNWVNGTVNNLSLIHI